MDLLKPELLSFLNIDLLKIKKSNIPNPMPIIIYVFKIDSKIVLINFLTAERIVTHN